MFNAFRDAIFAPKKIILYRNKPGWFVFLYILVVALVGVLSSVIRPLSYNELTMGEKINWADTFNGSSAEITNYTYDAKNDITLQMGDIAVGFVPQNESIEKYLQTTDADYVVQGSSIYLIFSVFTSAYGYEVGTLKSISSNLENVSLSTITESSAFFNGVNQAIKTLKVNYTLIIGGISLISQIVTMLIFVLITYLFALLAYRAQEFMRKKQLFKMLIFASTGVMLAEDIVVILNFTGILSYIVMFIGFIPLYILEREIFRRIQMFLIAKNSSNNQNFSDNMKKLQELLKNQKKDDDEPEDGYDEDDNNDDRSDDDDDQ